MAWLTVRETAERLEISEAAVRKRVERGTLGHQKWSDGRVYIYVPASKDAEKGAEKYEAPQAAEDPAQSQPRSWLEYVAVGTGVIAILGALTYAQGLLTLWIPIWRTYTGDASSAWYAASLVPSTVVAGLGIVRLVVSGTGAIIVGIVTYLLFALVPRYARKRWGNKASSVATWLLVAGIAAYVAWAFALVFRTVLAWSLPMSVAAGVVVAFIIPFALPLLGQAFFQRRRRRSRTVSTEAPDKRDTQEPSYKGKVDSAATNGEAPKAANDNSKRFSMRWLWPGWAWVMFIIAFYYVHFTFLVVMDDPALPTVEVSGVKDMEGTLLTHTDGFWYIFDVAGENKGDLIVLRDDLVETGTLSSGGK